MIALIRVQRGIAIVQVHHVQLFNLYLTDTFTFSCSHTNTNTKTNHLKHGLINAGTD